MKPTLFLPLSFLLAATALAATAPSKSHPLNKPAAKSPAPPLQKTNPLLPPQIPLDSLFIDLSLVQKLPAITPAGGASFDPLYSAADWQSFRSRFAAQADALPKLKSSAQLAFADELAASATEIPSTTPGLRRLLLLRTAAIAYRSREGFPHADSAVQSYLAIMDKKSPTQLAALWCITNVIARTAVTPKPDRIRYDALAAKANMQLALTLLDADQVDPAESIIKQIAYHEGWLKSDPATRAQIAHVRAKVKQTAAMMDFLATQYQPAIHNDPNALLFVYLYGRFYKNNLAIVADLPPRLPNSPLAHLAAALSAAGYSSDPSPSPGSPAHTPSTPERFTLDPSAAFTAAELLRAAAATLPDPLLKQRTLYAALQLYNQFLTNPKTEHDRTRRTLARIAREAVVADGGSAHNATPLDPFAPPPLTATAPAPAHPPHPHPTPEPLTGTPDHPVG